jgi:hypothetical protein
LKAFLHGGGGEGVQLAIGFLLSPGSVLEALLYHLGTCIETTKVIINVEEALVDDAILLLMVPVRVALRIGRAIGWLAPKAG